MYGSYPSTSTHPSIDCNTRLKLNSRSLCLFQSMINPEAATRIFTSNLNPRMAQRYFNLVLLPRVRDDIAEYKKLNFHLYMALKKSLFKPAAFFKVRPGPFHGICCDKLTYTCLSFYLSRVYFYHCVKLETVPSVKR